MKTAFPNSAKRVLSLVLAFVMLVGTLFVANVGVNINASAETATQEAVEKTKILYWDASGTKTAPKDANGDGIYEITSVAELHYVCTGGTGEDFSGKTYKVADDIKAFVLQPNTVITDLEAFKALDADGVKSFFSGKSPVNWVKAGSNAFNGNFDGNGVEIYGLYSDSIGTPTMKNTGQNSALFPLLEGGHIGDNGDGSYNSTNRSGYTITVYYDNDGISIGNFALKNGYVKGYQRSAAIFSTTNSSVWASGSTNSTHANYLKGVDGCIKLYGLEVKNCYIEGVTTYYSDAKGTTTDYPSANAKGEKGILLGSANGGDTVQISDCFLSGNVGKHADLDFEFGLYGTIGKNDGGQDNVVRAVPPSINNVVVLGSSAYDTSWASQYCTYTNVYIDTGSAKTGVTKLASADDAKGSIGKTMMSGLTWATAATAGQDIVQWYARENDYPTLFMPAGWKDTVKGYSIWGGPSIEVSAIKYDNQDEENAGTKENPYIISNANQLWKMVKEGGYATRTVTTVSDYNGAYSKTTIDGKTYYNTAVDNFEPTTKTYYNYTAKYFKVADGVDVIYLNNILSNDTLAGVKAIASTGNKWDPGTTFCGNFDGNGVTIRGMITSNGFVPTVDGADCVIKNVHFDACYVAKTNATSAAIVTTATGGYQYSYYASAEDFRSAPADTANGVAEKKQKTTAVAHDSYITIANTSIRNCYISTNRTSMDRTAAGIAAIASTPDRLTLVNCLYDGATSELIDGNAGNGYNAASVKAGLVSMSGSGNNVAINNCVSIGEYFISMASANAYNRYNTTQTGSMSFLNVFSPIGNTSSPAGVVYDKIINATTDISAITSFKMSDMPMLDWLNVWSLKTENDCDIPVITGVSTAAEAETMTQQLEKQLNGIGANIGSIKGQNGKYGWEHLLVGKGTEEEPYIIKTAFELARAIGSGAVNLNNKLHYQLGCDIDLGGVAWLTQVENSYYTYVPFKGTLDGAGHIITGLSATDSAATGLIPVLDGGTIKNLHLRGSYAGSTSTAGVLVGEALNDATVTGCSVENSLAVASNSSALLVGAGTATITDSYYIADGVQTFYDENGANNAPTVLYPADGAKWYKVAKNETSDGLPRLVSMAKAHLVTDIDGDGEYGGEFFTAFDLATLRRCILNHDGYTNAYGDINGDGRISVTDLALVRRQMTDTFNSINDGFWRNVELGKVSIYYDCNDSMDMARKLELYLESVYPQNDIKKYASSDVYSELDVERYDSIPSQHAIVITKTFNKDTYDQYSVNYDAANNVLKINGNSFTAVEQAVLDFIANADTTKQLASFTGSILELTKGAIESTRTDGTDFNEREDYKKAVTVEGNTYYYAWGDEFDVGNTFDTNNWIIGSYKSEGDTINADGTITTPNNRARDTANPYIKDMDNLWVVQNGRLKVYRGVNIDATDTDALNSATLTEFNNIKNAGEGAISSLGYVGVKNGNGDTVNDSGAVVNDDDVFVDPGIIKTPSTMLFKQGYAEARVSLPSDGYAFPAWWTLGSIGSRNSQAIDRSLYGKVYKLNNTGDYAWDGTTTSAKPDGTADSLKTYKYKIPRGHLEFDVIELMQAGSGAAAYYDYFQLTIHRIYDEHNVNKTDLYIPLWDNDPTVTPYYHDTISNFVTTSSDGTFIHHYNNRETTIAKYPYITISREGNWDWNSMSTVYSYSASASGNMNASFSLANALAGINRDTDEATLKSYYDAGNTHGVSNSTSHKALQNYYTYGFSWFADEEAKTYNLTIYCDINNDGIMTEDEVIFNMDQDNCNNCTCCKENNKYVTDPTWTSSNDDVDLWNQYTYMLLDNAYYTSPSDASAINDTLLTDGGADGDKTTFEIEYMRVYQLDGKRDIVTPETEPFNNGDRFNYGKSIQQ